MDHIFLLYLVTRLDTANTLFMMMTVFGIIIVCILAFISLVSEGDITPLKSSTFYRRVLIGCIITGILGATLVPTQKDAMFIAAGVGVIEGTRALQGSEMAKTSVKIVENWLRQQEEEGRKKLEEVKK